MCIFFIKKTFYFIFRFLKCNSYHLLISLLFLNNIKILSSFMFQNFKFDGELVDTLETFFISAAKIISRFQNCLVSVYLVSKLQVLFQLHETSETNCLLQIKFPPSCILKETLRNIKYQEMS